MRGAWPWTRRASSAGGAVFNPRRYSDRKGEVGGAPKAVGTRQAARRGGGLGYKDLRVQGLQQASRVSGEAAERAQYSLCYLLSVEKCVPLRLT